MNTRKVYYLLILLGLIYNVMLMFSDCSVKQENPKEITLTVDTNLIETK